MAKRRANQEGSVYQRKDKRWVTQIEVGKTVDDKPIYKYFYRKSQKDAIAILKKYNNPLSLKHLNMYDAYLDEYINNWLISRKLRTLKPASYDRLESTIVNHINPNIGHYKLHELTTSIIQIELINKMVTDKLSYSSVKKAKDALHNCLEDAVYDDHIPKNPIKKVEIPQEKNFDTEEIVFFTKEEIKRFEDICVSKYKTNHRRYSYGSAYLLILYTGLRMGEALALKWNNIDFEAKTLTTNGNMILIKNRDIDADNNSDIKKYIYIHQDTTKSQKRVIDRRVVPLSNKAISALQDLKANIDSGKNGYIICTKHLTPILPNVFDRPYKKILQKANIKKCGIHSLRHTFASILFENSIDIKTVSEILGHANTQITYNKYVHLLKQQKHDAVNVFDNL